MAACSAHEHLYSKVELAGLRRHAHEARRRRGRGRLAAAFVCGRDVQLLNVESPPLGDEPVDRGLLQRRGEGVEARQARDVHESVVLAERWRMRGCV